jgi:hypothetical protein
MERRLESAKEKALIVMVLSIATLLVCFAFIATMKL